MKTDECLMKNLEFAMASSDGNSAISHDTVRDDPCHLGWQVKKILWLDLPRHSGARPPAGSSGR